MRPWPGTHGRKQLWYSYYRDVRDVSLFLDLRCNKLSLIGLYFLNRPWSPFWHVWFSLNKKFVVWRVWGLWCAELNLTRAVRKPGIVLEDCRCGYLYSTSVSNKQLADSVNNTQTMMLVFLQLYLLEFLGHIGKQGYSFAHRKATPPHQSHCQ